MVSSRILLFSATLLAAGLLVPASQTSASAALPDGCTQPDGGGPVTCTFGFTGADQTFTVPAGVTSVSLTAWGGHGAGSNNQAGGGRGALVSGTFAVTPGDQLTVTVAGDGGVAAGGFGFGTGGSSTQSTTGGGGGGASAVSLGSTWLLVAGGGGGMGEANDPGDCGFGGAGGDAGQDGSAGADCTVPGGTGGSAGSAPGHDGASSVTGFIQDGGGGGGGVKGGGAGGGSNLINSNACCSSAGGGGGGTSGADASGTDVSLSGLSERGQGENGLVEIQYTPVGPATSIVLTPASSTVAVGHAQSYTVTAFNSDDANIGDVTADSVLSISPDGSCTEASCTPTTTGPHTVTATDGSLTDTAALQVTKAPVFTSARSATFTRGRAGRFVVRADGTPPPTIRRVRGHLPAGLALVGHGDGTATLSGTPTGRPGTTDVVLRARSDAGTARQTLAVTVVPTPGRCANRFAGTAHADRLRGTTAGDRLLGERGDDQLLGFGGRDCESGGPGRDGLWGDRGADRLSGGPDGDVLHGGRGPDRLLGGAGPDRLVGSSGPDILVGGPGRDVLSGGPGGDTIRTADGVRDVVSCGRGTDRVVADPRDVLRGCEQVTLRRG